MLYAPLSLVPLGLVELACSLAFPLARCVSLPSPELLYLVSERRQKLRKTKEELPFLSMLIPLFMANGQCGHNLTAAARLRLRNISPEVSWLPLAPLQMSDS